MVSFLNAALFMELVYVCTPPINNRRLGFHIKLWLGIGSCILSSHALRRILKCDST